MWSGILFVTARCDSTPVNQLLYELRKIPNDDSHFVHVTLTRSAADVDDAGKEHYHWSTAAGSLTRENFDRRNEWAGASVRETEAFILHEVGRGWTKAEHALFLVLDDEGVEKRNLVIAAQNMHRPRGQGGEAEGREERFDFDFAKIRVPWEEAWSAFVNLDGGNRDFVEFCQQLAGPDQDGWWTA